MVVTDLSTRRVAVVSSSLRKGVNDMWEASRPYLGDLLIVGNRDTAEKPHAPGYLGLREFDLGRGLIWRHLWRLRSKLLDFRPHLIHVNGELWSWTVQRLLSLDIPMVVHGAENIWEHGSNAEQFLRKRLVYRALSSTAGYASWNLSGALHISSLARPNFPTAVLPAIIPPAPFREARWSGPRKKFVRTADLLLVGRLDRQKGFGTALTAVAQSKAKPAIRVLVCGDGPDRDALVRQAEDLKIELELLGQVNQERLAEVMSDATCLVQPSISTPHLVEQFGRAVAEAMSVGLPCIVSDSGELPHLVGDERAIFREGDPADLARRIDQIVFDPALRAALSVSQHSRSAAYAPDQAARSIVHFWGCALGAVRG